MDLRWKKRGAPQLFRAGVTSRTDPPTLTRRCCLRYRRLGEYGVSTGTVTSQGSFSVGHTYVVVLPQSFTVRVTVTDSHGASASDTKVVSVLLL